MAWWQSLLGIGRAVAPSQGQLVTRNEVDKAINEYFNFGGSRIDPAQYAQQLSNNKAGVSYQEILSRLQSAPANDPTMGMQAVSAEYSPYSGTGGARAYDPTTDPTQVAQKRNQVMGLRGGLDNLFNQIYSGINTQAAQQQAESQQAFKTGQDALTNNFMRNDNQNAAAYTSRNAYDSSFRANAQDQIKNDFNTQSQQNQQSYDKRLADIGNYVATARAGVESSRPQWDVYNQYNNTNDLTSAYNQLMGLEGNLRQQLAGLGSNDAYRQLAQSVTPYAQQQSQGIVDQLQKLAGSAGDANSKQVAAGTYIAQLPDQNTKDYWQKFFDSQTQGA